MILLTVTFTYKDSLQSMMRSDYLNLHVYPVKTDMTGMQQIFAFHVCYTNERILEWFLVEKTLLQVCSTDEDE